MERIFIMSPASTAGRRAAVLMNEKAEFELAVRLRTKGAPLGEVFSFLSGLYFRGKLAYCRHFGRPPRGVERGYVITSDAGLRSPDEMISLARLKEFSLVNIDAQEPRYSEPLSTSAEALRRKLGSNASVVLLGSLATCKYTEVLLEHFGERLHVPRDFIGRGDMSRGGLMLRAVESNTELEYVPLLKLTSRRGTRPPKLLPLPRKSKRSGGEP
jgi:hypothetical protein